MIFVTLPNKLPGSNKKLPSSKNIFRGAILGAQGTMMMDDETLTCLNLTFSLNFLRKPEH
jgi:hypothetical protein